MGVQDWATGGLSLFLWNNAGATARVVVQAHGKATAIAPATPGIDATVNITEGTYGGQAGEYAEFDVELPCTVRPTLAVATPTTEIAQVEPGEEAPEAPAAKKAA